MKARIVILMVLVFMMKILKSQRWIEENLTLLLILDARDQPQLIQGIRRRDGVGEDQETTA